MQTNTNNSHEEREMEMEMEMDFFGCCSKIVMKEEKNKAGGMS